MTEVNIVELDLSAKNEGGVTVGFRWNFCAGTTKETNYMNSSYIKTLLHTVLRGVKVHEGDSILKFSPRRKDDNKNVAEHRDISVELPNNGREFFFSNTLMKVY